MDKKKRSGDFYEIRVFTKGVIENEIKIPKNCFKSISKLSLRDKASMKVFLVDKDYADILNAKL